MFRYGEKVVIRDGSKLDGSPGIVYSVKDGQVMVLIEREVLWPVAETNLEPQGPGQSEGINFIVGDDRYS